MSLRPSQDKPWLKLYTEDVLSKSIPYRTIYDMLVDYMDSMGEHDTLYYFGTKVSSSELIKNIDKVADAFYGIGIREGDSVSCILPTTPEAVYILYGLNKIGAFPNFIDPRYSPDRILDAINIVNPKMVLMTEAMFDKILEIKDQLCVDRIVSVSPYLSLPPVLNFLRKLKSRDKKIEHDDFVIDWKNFMSYADTAQAVKVPFKEDSIAAITYTGGTTGTPKGVALTNDGLNTMAESFIRLNVDGVYNPRFLGFMPPSTSYGIGCGIHMPLCYKGCLYLIPVFTPDELGGLIKKYKIGHMMAVPTFYERIMNSKALKNENLSYLITCGCGGDAMNDSLEEEFNKFLKEHKCKYPVSQGYGLSEMSGAATCCYNNVYRKGSVGIPLMFSDAGVFDPETGEELGYNDYGEVCLGGRSMMLGYYNNQEETDLVIRKHEDGKKWVHTGDIGYIDEDGFIYIKGRIKRVVVRADGHKVFPLNIETVLDSRDEVRSSAVIAIPDRSAAQGEVPLAIVEVNPDAIKDTNLEQLRVDLLNYCDKKCEERGRAADIVFIDEMLYTGMGKHDFQQLQLLYKDHVVKPH